MMNSALLLQVLVFYYFFSKKFVIATRRRRRKPWLLINSSVPECARFLANQAQEASETAEGENATSSAKEYSRQVDFTSGGLAG